MNIPPGGLAALDQNDAELKEIVAAISDAAIRAADLPPEEGHERAAELGRTLGNYVTEMAGTRRDQMLSLAIVRLAEARTAAAKRWSA